MTKEKLLEILDMTDGKIRCEKVQLIGTVKEDKNGSMDSMGG